MKTIKMYKLIVTILFACNAFIMGCTNQADTTTTHPELKALARLTNNENGSAGNVIFTETEDGVKAEIKVKRIPEGKHAVHIHETGKCIAPDFLSAGGHFNPERKKHGKNNPNGPHVGDMENISTSIKTDMQTNVTLTIHGVTLKKGKKNSLLKEGETAIVIHKGPDDYKTDPAGNAGKRIACGVIRERN